MSSNCTYVVILNWNSWGDTIACLESVFLSRAARFRVVVCDNQSTDTSLSSIAAWARGEIAAPSPKHPRLRRLVGHCSRPIAYSQLTATEVNSAGASDEGASLVIIDNEANLGFAGGNNVGIRFALAQEDMTHIWLLNNDTIIDPDCLANMQKRLAAEKAPSACGSIIHFFDQPETIQAIGGNRFNKRTGVAMQSAGRFKKEQDIGDCKAAENEIDYISGCSWMMPRCLLEEVGLLNENYFLYYEEIDWFTRAGNYCQRCVAKDAHVYHREGGSIGSPTWQRRTPSLIADYHVFRSKHLFMRRYYPGSMIWCYLSSWAEVGKRLLRRQYKNARIVCSVLLAKHANVRSFGSGEH
ncbi:glycosyltransferase family 2 protein [Pseudomaricurvus alkylphenolicus]|uniref:glycosyltransferase n=1 Tax=Pseudomaricurvus alkylphenolicus TaxID=1306991 RepID=UPI00142167B1|nr:glycosyltransferase family 2 protein [Pseudomaricurvus alkylphenolicus]NIB39709.1 glycosyltransferase family 2 protein [Pseudomaricurvus alkylphenolicus]